MFKHKIHPELFDDFISLVDSVFDVRIPPLLTVLHHYRAFAKIEETDNQDVDNSQINSEITESQLEDDKKVEKEVEIKE